MKSLEEKMEFHWKLALPIIKVLSDNHQDQDKAIFNYGWDACAKEYEKENAELKKKLEIAKEALGFYADGDHWAHISPNQVDYRVLILCLIVLLTMNGLAENEQDKH